MELSRKIDFAKKLIESAAEQANKDCELLELAYSGGKDSDVMLYIARQVLGNDFVAIYKNTTIDPRGTIKHALSKGVEVRNPKKSFRQLIEDGGFPGRKARFCCRLLKEYKIHKHVLMGIRAAESTKRASYEPQECRKGKVKAYYPLLYFTKDDIATFADRVSFHPLYYDADGNFHPERRLGCMGCPLASVKIWTAQFKANPALLRMWLRAGKVYLLTHPDSESAIKFADVYELFANKFYNSSDWKTGLFNVDAKKMLADVFGEENIKID